MSKDTLCDSAKSLIMQYQLSQYQQNQFNKYISTLKTGNYVYPGMLKSRMNLEIKIVYEILDALRKEGFLSFLYEVYCFNCDRSTGVYLDSLSEFDEDMCCNSCSEKLNVADNLIVLYKVVKI